MGRAFRVYARLGRRCVGCATRLVGVVTLRSGRLTSGGGLRHGRSSAFTSGNAAGRWWVGLMLGVRATVSQWVDRSWTRSADQRFPGLSKLARCGQQRRPIASGTQTRLGSVPSGRAIVLVASVLAVVV